MSPRPLATATILALLVAACGDDPTGGNGDTPAPAWDLVFAGDSAGATRLYRTTGAARSPRLVRAGLVGTGPVASADGTRLLYTAPGVDPEPPYLMLLDADAAQPVRLRAAPGVYEREGRWSPGGTHVAFTSQVDDPFGGIIVARVEARAAVDARNVTDAGGGSGASDVTPAWSPDGMRIAFTSYRGGNPSIWVMNADGSLPMRLTPPGDWGDYFPTWSPSGDSVAFQRLSQGAARIGIVGASGGTPRFLALPGKAFAPAWAPDGARLAVVLELPSGERDVHVVGTDGAVRERIMRAGNDALPSWLRRRSPF